MVVAATLVKFEINLKNLLMLLDFCLNIEGVKGVILGIYTVL